MLSYNMFAYCNNNPINFEDSTGQLPKWLKKAVEVVKTTVNTVKNVVKTVVNKVEKVKEIVSDKAFVRDTLNIIATNIELSAGISLGMGGRVIP